MRRNGDRGKPGGDREILDRSYGFHRTGDRWLPDRWLGMPPFSGVVPPPVDQPVKIDSYPPSNLTSWDNYFDGGIVAMGQAFPCPASGTIYSVKFYLKKVGTPPAGSLTAKLYASTGAMGSDAVWTGSVLAQSTPVPVSGISTAGGFVEFLFTGTYPLLSGTNYAVLLEQTGLNSSSFTNNISLGIDDDGIQPNHPGNWFASFAGSPFPDQNCDCIFELYTGTPAPVAPPVPVMLDSWPLSNQNDISSYCLDADVDAAGQAFTSAGGKLTSVKFGLKKFGAPTGNVVAALYAATGSYPAVKATGPALATSDPVAAASITTLSDHTVGIWQEFKFTGANQFQFVSGTKYVICVQAVSGTVFDFTNKIGIGLDFDFSGPANPGHGGNYTNRWRGTWSADDMGDCVFELWGLPAAGTFIVSDIYDPSQMDWNNYPLRGWTQRNFQTFVGDGGLIHGVRFMLAQGMANATAHGTLVARLYLSGGELPYGEPLTSSEPIEAETITNVAPDYKYIDFIFSEDVTLEEGLDYAVSIEKVNPPPEWDATTNGWIDVAADHIGVHGGRGGYMQYANDLLVGTWTPTPMDLIFAVVTSGEGPPPGPGEPIDQVPVQYGTMTNRNLCDGFTTEIAQIIKGKGHKLHSVKFQFQRRDVGTTKPSPPVTAPLVATLYANESGYTPTGSALATSAPIDPMTVSETEWLLYEFVFDDSFTMEEGVNYGIALSWLNNPDPNWAMYVSTAGASNHPGNLAHFSMMSGAWASQVSEDMIFYLYAAPQPVLIDSWPIEQQSTTYAHTFGTDTDVIGQSFVASGDFDLHSVKFSLGKINTPIGTLVAELYEAVAGLPVTGAVALAVSDTIINVPDLVSDGSTTMWEFLFSSGAVVAGNEYVIGLTLSGGNTDSANVIRIGNSQGASLGHPGNIMKRNKTTGAWTKNAFAEMIFYLYGKP